MLKPSMQELMKKVNNRYLLVNLAAQRARDISGEADEDGAVLHDKPVKLALDEIAAGLIEYRSSEKKKSKVQTSYSCNICAPIDDEDGASFSSEEDN